LGGTYINTSYNFVTSGDPDHNITFEVDTTALRGHLDSYYYDFATYPSLATQSWVTSNFDNYTNWNLQTGGVHRESITTGFDLDFIGDTTYIQVQYNTTDDRLEFSYIGPTSFYSGWDLKVDASAVNTIGSGEELVFTSGTNITLGYTVGAGTNDITINADLSSYYTSAQVDAGFYSRTYIDANFYTQTYINANFDDYDHWKVHTGGVFRENIAAGDLVDFIGGTDISVVYSTTGNTLTFNYTGTPGTMSSWNWEIEGTPHSISNLGTAELIAGTNITISYSLGGGGEHQATINSTDQYQGTVTAVTGGVGINSTGGTTPDISLNVSELAVGGTLIAGDWLVADNGGVSNRQLISAIPLSIFNNDAGWTTNVGTVTSVAGGTGISSTGTAAITVALTVDELAEKTGALVGTDRLVGTSGTTNFAETINQIPLSIFINDAGWASGTGDMDSWNWEILGVPHSISNGGTLI
jgi:hypothetical protein